MYYKEIQPPPPLADLIRYYWVLEDHPGNSEVLTFRVLADGYPGFIFTYGNEICWQLKSSSSPVPRCSIFGVLQQYQDLSVRGAYGILGISFFPYSFHTLLNISAEHLCNRTVDVEDLYGTAGKQLTEKLLNAADNAERIACINGFISRIQRGTSVASVAIRQSIQGILAQKGAVPVSRLAQQLDISRRHYERTFKAAIGMSPKQFSRIIRFQHVLRHPNELKEISFADLALTCGYSDQSHFIREFKTFAGLTPRYFFSETDEVVENFVHLSE